MSTVRNFGQALETLQKEAFGRRHPGPEPVHVHDPREAQQKSDKFRRKKTTSGWSSGPYCSRSLRLNYNLDHAAESGVSRPRAPWKRDFFLFLGFEAQVHVVATCAQRNINRSTDRIKSEFSLSVRNLPEPPSTGISQKYRSSQNNYRQSCYSWEFISRKLPLPLPSWNSDELPLPSPSWPPQLPLHFPLTPSYRLESHVN